MACKPSLCSVALTFSAALFMGFAGLPVTVHQKEDSSLLGVRADGLVAQEAQSKINGTLAVSHSLPG